MSQAQLPLYKATWNAWSILSRLGLHNWGNWKLNTGGLKDSQYQKKNHLSGSPLSLCLHPLTVNIECMSPKIYVFSSHPSYIWRVSPLVRLFHFSIHRIFLIYCISCVICFPIITLSQGVWQRSSSELRVVSKHCKIRFWAQQTSPSWPLWTQIIRWHWKFLFKLN